MHDLTYIRERQLDKLSAMTLRWPAGMALTVAHIACAMSST